MGPVETEGDSIDAAIAAALQQLGATRDRVEVEILQNSGRGLFGFGGKKAKVRATLRRPILEELHRAEPQPEEASTSEPAVTPSPRPEKKPPVRTEKKPEARAGKKQPVRTEKKPVTRPEERPAAAPAPREFSDAAVQRAQEALQRIIKLMDVQATVSAKKEEEHIVLELDGDSSGVLIGRKGQMLDALEYVIARIVGRDEGTRVPVLVDSQSYRTRRMEALGSLAQRMAAEAKRKRNPVTLNAMSPRDRRIVHMILQRDPSLTTRSSGKGYYRRLVILPAANASPESHNA
jgi:spoIIIJ-associated protein